MKLKCWADKQGIAYITAWRWFKDGKLPSGVEAYQTDSGTIMVKELVNNNTDCIDMQKLLAIALEYTNNNKTPMEFAAYIISEYNLSSKK